MTTLQNYLSSPSQAGPEDVLVKDTPASFWNSLLSNFASNVILLCPKRTLKWLPCQHQDQKIILRGTLYPVKYEHISWSLFLNLGEIVVLLYNTKCKLGITVWSTDDVILTSILGNICRPLCNSSEIGHCHKKRETGSDESCIYRVPVIILYDFDLFFTTNFRFFMLSDMRTVRYKMQEFYISLINLSVTMLVTTSDVHLLFTLWVFCHLIFLEEILMVLF